MFSHFARETFCPGVSGQSALTKASAWDRSGSKGMNLIPHVNGAGTGCLHELRGTIVSIADELAAEILCDWALDSASKALEQSRLEFAHDRER